MAVTPFRNPQQIQAALELLVDECGSEALSLPGVLPGLLADLMPYEPQAIRILTAAAEIDLLGQLSEHMKRGMDITPAIQLATVAFADATMFAAEACAWIVNTYAKIAGLAGEYPCRPGIVIGAENDDAPEIEPAQTVDANLPQGVHLATAHALAVKDQPDKLQHVTLTWPPNDSQRIVAALAEVNVLRTTALTEAEQKKAAATQEAGQIIAAAQQQADNILGRAHTILLESQRRNDEINGMQSAAKVESQRIIANANRQAQQIIAGASPQPSQQPPENGVLRRLAKAQPTTDAVPDTAANIVRQQPPRQSRSKRSGKR
jgi:cell division septum initiation protein DivIVA